jgi:hypothetical protein
MSHAIAIVTEVVATGTFAQIERWTELLRQVGIVYEVRWSCGEHRPQRHDRAELWVENYKIERARSAIRGTLDADPSLLW